MQSRIRYKKQSLLTEAFLKFPKFLLSKEFSKVPSDAKILYTVMLSRHNLSLRNKWFDDNGDVYIYYKREQMQADISKSDKTVKKAIEDLKAFGLIDERQQGLNKPNKIYLLAPIVCDDDSSDPDENSYEFIVNTGNSRTRKNSEPEPGNIPTPDTENLRVQTRKNSDPGHGKIPCQEAEILRPNKIKFNKTELNEIEGNNTHQPPTGEREGAAPIPLSNNRGREKPETVADERFHEFWLAYPRKEGKGQALKTWSKIKPCAELFAKIMQAVEVAKLSPQWNRDGGRYIPHPSTWLSQRRWDDEPDLVSVISPAPDSKGGNPFFESLRRQSAENFRNAVFSYE